MDALAFIEKNGMTRCQPYYVVSGDEDFLKRHVLDLLGPIVLGDADPEFSASTFPGEKTDFSTVRNELDSVSFFSSRRLVVVEQADTFVTKYRPQLEAYVADPSEVGVLVLEVRLFPATTKLAKAVPDAAHIVCKAPSDARLPGWCAAWCQSRYGKKLTTPAAQVLVLLVGSTMGVLDQELQKLSDYAGERPTIDVPDVEELVGKSRLGNVFRIMESMVEGKADDAIGLVTELLNAGEPPLKLLGAIGYQVRRLGRTARLHKAGMGLDEAMVAAGVPNYPPIREAARKQLRHLGWNRLEKLFDWMVELDLGLKGGNPLPERLQLERMIVRLARPARAPS